MAEPRHPDSQQTISPPEPDDPDTAELAEAREEPLPPAPFVITKEHCRFTEFADACRRHRYIGLCYGPPGVGKTLSARTYACWDEVSRRITHLMANLTRGRNHPEWHTVLYTPTVSATPRVIDKDLCELSERLADIRGDTLKDPRLRANPHGSSQFTELLIVDEADRLKVPALEQLRDHYDRSHLGLILIGMPGIEKRLARYPQLYSRVGFVHHYRPLSAGEQAFVLARHWPHLHLDDPDDYTTAEAIAAITRITGGNFRLTSRLIAQVERILDINQLGTVTKEVIEAARESLVIGTI
jgi:DNA transposition AAA+ family ATPase